MHGSAPTMVPLICYVSQPACQPARVSPQRWTAHVIIHLSELGDLQIDSMSMA